MAPDAAVAIRRPRAATRAESVFEADDARHMGRDVFADAMADQRALANAERLQQRRGGATDDEQGRLGQFGVCQRLRGDLIVGRGKQVTA